jgi:hypothetical protein
MPTPPTQTAILAMFKKLAEHKELGYVKREVEEGTTVVDVKRKGVERKETRRGKSQTVLDAIHRVLGDNHLDCKNAELPCLNALIEEFMGVEIAKEAIDSLAVLLPVLYTKISVLNSALSTISVTIQKKFHTHKDIVAYSKAKLRLSKEERKLQQINYAAKVAKANEAQKEVSDTKVLGVINSLRDSPRGDYISKICLVGLCVGSRISEIVSVSTYTETDNPHWIQVEGVSKERKQVDEKGGPGVPAAPRTFKKPIILLTSGELIDNIVALREELEKHYGVDLGEGEAPEEPEEMSVKRLVSLVDNRANKKMRELFGEDYTFHMSRAIFAQMAWISYAPPGMSQTSFYSQVLGHKEGSLTTALSYQTFSIRRTLKEDDPALVARMTDLEAELKHLKQTEKKHFEAERVQVAKADNQVVFPTTPQGISLTLKKQPRLHEGPEKRMARLKTLVEEMQKAGVRPTHRNVASLGFGSAVVNRFFKEQKANKEKKQVEEVKG